MKIEKMTTSPPAGVAGGGARGAHEQVGWVPMGSIIYLLKFQF